MRTPLLEEDAREVAAAELADEVEVREAEHAVGRGGARRGECAQCGDAEEECGRGESDVEEEKDGSDSELCALKVVAVVKDEMEAEAVEVKDRSSVPAPAFAGAGGKCGQRAASEESGEKATQF